MGCKSSKPYQDEIAQLTTRTRDNAVRPPDTKPPTQPVPKSLTMIHSLIHQTPRSVETSHNKHVIGYTPMSPGRVPRNTSLVTTPVRPHHVQSVLADKTVDFSVITLNVGGLLFTTSNATLSQEPHSALAALCQRTLSGDADPYVRDDKGNIFLDLNPSVFMKLLDYMRARRIMGETAPAPKLLPEEDGIFEAMVQYLRLQPFFLRTPFVTHDRGMLSDRFSDSLHSTNILIRENGQTATVREGTTHGFVLGTLLAPYAEWKIKIEKMQESHWLMIGVCNKQPTSTASYGCRGTYGWTGGRSQWQFVDGLNSRCGPVEFSEGDVVCLSLWRSELTLTVPRTSASYRLNVPEGMYQLHANLYCVGDSIRLLE